MRKGTTWIVSLLLSLVAKTRRPAAPPSLPKLPKKYIFIALRSVMLDYPMDLCPAAAKFLWAAIALSSAAHWLYPIAGGPNL
jgi:hypothetical protein